MRDPLDGDTNDFLDPEVDEPDGEQSGPSTPEVHDPTSSVEIPDTTASYNKADPVLKAQFWKLVLVYKVGILATSLGAVVVYFRGSTLAAQAAALGVVTLAYALYETRNLKGRVDAGEFEHDDPGVVEHADENEDGNKDDDTTEGPKP